MAGSVFGKIAERVYAKNLRFDIRSAIDSTSNVIPPVKAGEMNEALQVLYIQKGGRLGRKPGSRKTAEQRKEEYREAIALLKKGYSIRNVAKLTGKAVSTIQQVKKDFINS